ncbi:MAG: beta-glucosidase [Chlorobi bacterium]|nr:beta-glucosidase [Chlorobiota bacterium]
MKSSLISLLVLTLLFNVPATAENNNLKSGERSTRSKKKSSIYHDGWIDFNKNGKKDIYEDPLAKIDDRVADLLRQMTLEEKTMQMVTLYGYGRVAKDQIPTPEWKNAIWKDGLANIDEHCNGVAKTDYGYPYSKHVWALNEVQKFFVEQTRLGIPVEFTTEGIRGLNHTKATSFPAQIGMGSSWDKELVRKTGEVTGSEAYALGYNNVYSPIMDVSRDQRWGRIVETYGEDPFLVAELGVQQVKGIQSNGVVSTMKHFAVYSVPKGGRDGDARTDPHVTERELHQLLLYSFRRGIEEAGALGVMSSYNDYNGVPVSGSKYFLTDLLRNQYHFKGYVVSDSWAVRHIHSKHKVADTYKEAVRQAVEAGLNVRTTFESPGSYVKPLKELIAEGSISEETINDRVSDVLRVKFIEGLFDKPYRDEEYADKFVNNDEHKEIALQASRESIVLLKNENNLLPLDISKYKNILVCGPNAKAEKSSESRYGPNGIDVISGYEGIVDMLGKQANIDYAQGCFVFDKNTWPESELYPIPPSEEETALMNEAVKKAAASDLIIAFFGDNTETVGESRSRTSLDLPGNQREFLMKLKKTGKPIVMVLINGRPMSINWANDNIPAIVEAWFPGMYGGQAIAEVLTGKYNPGGKMPVTTPKTVGQILMNFPFKKGSQAGQPQVGPNGIGKTRIIDVLYPFGYGLSYTTFKYSGLTISVDGGGVGSTVKISMDVTNTGNYDGDEVVQLYINDEYSSVVTYEKVLRGFERVHLKKGETKTVTFTIGPNDLALYDRHMDFVVEPGKFNVYLGSSSEDVRLEGAFVLEDKF